MSVALLRATLTAIGRLEARGDKPARLTEPGHEKWNHFRRRLGAGDFIALLHEDAAQGWPVPFDLSLWPSPPASLSEEEAERLVQACASVTAGDSMAWLRAFAAEQGLPGGALSDAPAFNPRDKVLDLSGGLIAAYACSKDPTLDMARQFTFGVSGCDAWVCVGLAAVELRAPVEASQIRVGALTEIDPSPFTRIVGLKAGASEAVITHFGGAARWL